MPDLKSWNLWHGCTKYSEGCENCYMYYLDDVRGVPERACEVKKTGDFNKPLKKNRKGEYKIPAGYCLRINMTSDTFLEEADGWRDEMRSMIRQRPDVRFFILTKRVPRIRECLPRDWQQSYPLFLRNKMPHYDRPKVDEIRKLLQSMIDVGLDYLTLGQPTSTLSGGEVQRVKLASELHKEGQVYVLDEPSTGLHVKDIEKLLALLRKLVDDGNTVVMIEHRPELIAQADWIIDIGPEGGSKGGEIVFTGTPEQILNCKESKTGKYL